MTAYGQVNISVGAGKVKVDPKAVREVSRRSPRVMADMARRGTNVVQAMLADPRTPTGSGFLKGTFRVQPGTAANPAGATVIVGIAGRTDYLGYIIDGTPPHIIEAKRTRPNPHLRFVQDGGIKFRRRVRHPGTKPNDFISRAIPAARR